MNRFDGKETRARLGISLPSPFLIIICKIYNATSSQVRLETKNISL
jgi:hypothetical protein